MSCHRAPSAPARHALAGFVLLLALPGAVAAAGASAQRPDVPDELRPWAEWVLHGHESELCPRIPGDVAATRCAWPARLRLELGDGSGRFEQQWNVRHRTWVPLPGDGSAWPLGVTVDGAPAAVVDVGGAPGTWLDEGRRTVAGAFAWPRHPESLFVPPATGLVDLVLDGAPVPFPSRAPDGRLWLGARAALATEAESLSLAVHRLAIDEVPLRLVTRLRLDVGGRAREMALGPVLPAGFVPLALDSPLPARLEPDGRLRIQARPGTWHVVVEARHVGPVIELAVPETEGPWPADEVWCFEARPELRVVEVDGVPAIDPNQTATPEDWKRFPTFRLERGQAMRLLERRRGDAEPAADQLALERTLWLDFDGGGLTARDHLGGTLSRSWRLESRPPWSLGHALVGGEDQLLTRRAEGAPPGMEVRQGFVDVVADSRLEGRVANMPAIGWEADMTSLSAVLNLPPGWLLVAAPGADAADGTWVDRWTLLDLFLALVVAASVMRLWGLLPGALALATMALTITEPGAPRWSWLVLLSVEAVRRILKHEVARRILGIVHLGILTFLLLVSVPFMLVQARDALYPQLATDRGGGAPYPVPMPARVADRDEMEQRARGAAAPEGRLYGKGQLENAMPTQSYAPLEFPPRKDALRIPHDPRDVVQTGPGVPSWTWRAHGLRWSGPVERDQDVRLVLLPPIVTSILGFLRIALLALLLARVAIPKGASWRRVPAAPARGDDTQAFPLGAPTSAIVVAVALSLLAAASPARAAEIPRKDLLDELRVRLLERPPCEPRCATVQRMDLEATPTSLSLRLDVGAEAESAVALPGGLVHWTPREILVDGQAATSLARTPDGVLWLLVPAGAHQVIVSGPLPGRDTVEIPLPERPRHARARAEGWTVAGIREDGSVDETLQLGRDAAPNAERAESLPPSSLPSFAMVSRSIELGLTWRATTTVRRLGSADAPILIEVPLLPGESVTTADVRVVGGRAVVSIPPGGVGAAWRSTLEEQPRIELVAPDVTTWTEEWILDASPLWHVEPSGIPPVHSTETRDVRMRSWRPWPGEKVTLDVTRPEAVPGPSLTVDGSTLQVAPGLRATDATLSVTLRSSRGGPHEIELPEGGTLQSLSVGGLDQPVRQDGRRVSVTLVPGSQEVTLTWRQPDGIRKSWRTPIVDLRAGGVDANVIVSMPENRWVLLTRGPRMGPAVLFWAVLVVLLLLAVGLGRWKVTPLGEVSWLLLFIGLSQVPAWAGGVVVAWFLLLAWRKGKGASVSAPLLAIVQVLLAAWTVAALVMLFMAIRQGLLGSPQMQVVGNGSTATDLRWYLDRIEGPLPLGHVVSAPLFAYRIAMLAWALWLAAALIAWMRWAWTCFSEGGAWPTFPPRAPRPHHGGRGPGHGGAPPPAGGPSAAGPLPPADARGRGAPEPTLPGSGGPTQPFRGGPPRAEEKRIVDLGAGQWASRPVVEPTEKSTYHGDEPHETD